MTTLHDQEFADTLEAEARRRRISTAHTAIGIASSLPPARRQRTRTRPALREINPMRMDWPEEVSNHPHFPHVAASLANFTGLDELGIIDHVAGILRMIDEADRRA